MNNVIDEKCDRLFALYDTDGNGRLDRHDVDLMVDKILAGGSIPADSPKAAVVRAEYDAWWQALLAHADSDADSVVTREEFRASMAGLAPGNPVLHDTVRKAVDAVFTAMDCDDDDRIPVPVLIATFIRGGVSEDDAAEAARAFDLDGDGIVTREEYAGPWLDFFTTDDPDAPASRILGKLS